MVRAFAAQPTRWCRRYLTMYWGEVEMRRREFVTTSLAVAALATGSERILASPAPAAAADVPFPKAPGLTKYVSEFVVNTKYEEISQDVLALGKKSILDGFGLALAGSASTMAPLVHEYLKGLGLDGGKSTIIGTALKAPPRFAAFANGISIHADDFDDTQLAAAKDRVYGLLTHPSVPVLSPSLALCELGKRSGKEFTLAYHVGV